MRDKKTSYEFQVASLKYKIKRLVTDYRLHAYSIYRAASQFSSPVYLLTGLPVKKTIFQSTSQFSTPVCRLMFKMWT